MTNSEADGASTGQRAVHWLIDFAATFGLTAFLTTLLGESPLSGTDAGDLSLGLSVCIALSYACLSWYYYTRISFGSSRNDPLKRAEYLDFRRALADGGLFRQLYLSGIEKLLSVTHRFFADRRNGIEATDVDVENSWSGLSVFAYDRWLLIGVLYPFISLFIAWGWTGKAGPVAEAIGLNDNVPGYIRGLLGLAGAVGIGLLIYSHRTEGWKKWLAGAGGVGGVVGGVGVGGVGIVVAVAVGVGVGVGVVGAVAGFGVVAIAIAIAIAISIAGIVAGAGAGAGAVAGFGVFAVGVAVGVAGVVVVVVVVAGVVAVGGVVAGGGARGGARRYAVALYGILSLSVFLVSILSPIWVSSSETWDIVGTLLLFFGVLVLANAPFDWLSLGLTMGFLQNGLRAIQADRPWIVVWWGVVDMFCAIVLVFVLAAVILFAVQGFNAATLLGGGDVLVPVGEILDALSSPYQRIQPQYWWIYIMIGSTLIPSIIHVSIATFAGLTWVMPNRWIRSRLQENGASIPEDRWWMAGLLAFLRVLSIIVGASLTWFVLSWVYMHKLPQFGGNWLEALEFLHQQDLPGRLVRWLFGGD